MGTYVEDPQFEALKRWAKTSDFPDPVRWGEVEAVILADPPPARDQMDPMLRKNDRVRSLVGYLIALPMVVVTFGSPLVVLGFVISRVVLDRSVPEDSWWFVLLRIEFFAAIVISVFPILMWWTTRRRGRMDLLLSGGSSAASFASVGLLFTTPRAGGWSAFAFYALIAAVAGLVVFVFMLVKARPGIRRPWRERWREITPEEKWYRGSRAGVLEELAQRGLVSTSDTTAMTGMPLRTWHELDENSPQAWVARDRTGA